MQTITDYKYIANAMIAIRAKNAEQIHDLLEAYFDKYSEQITIKNEMVIMIYNVGI
ncbi:MAG: hypothetical protein LBT25_06650 [Candidatus Symbiothrix sp.]|jgi:hypothetical protein|nr:hypothetical protein [Candidatus Symbiothrix sp.]